MSAAQDEFDQLMRSGQHRLKRTQSDDECSNSEEGASPEITTAQQRVGKSRDKIPKTRYQANTGPKGVISDAQDYADSRQRTQNGTRACDSKDDDDFMRKWRIGRLQELRSGRKAEIEPRQWGGMPTVDGERYLEAVDQSPSGTVVVVFIFDDRSQVSTVIEGCLRNLARRYADQTRFIKMHYCEAQMERAGVPALLAYEDGEKFATLVPLIDELPEEGEVSPKTVEAVLKEHNVLR
ncbi:thioredoxin-like protein [Piedraia hortae CBS 480.64]|uniref:Thioredoxin-like protein n=1 Tax=Piedraia hortae CBS 480.64 TaxID=1314780 RepID=A0A6A7C6R1_9PEZI|nr:thioredoxin-like protein [Piedraia hortae CBS 480.64]